MPAPPGSTLHGLVGTPPSGRPRPLLLDHDDYTTVVVRQGAPVDRSDVAEWGRHVGQVQGLLDPDAVWLDVAAFCSSALASDRSDLLAAMGARSRTGYPLRTLLADAALTEALRAVAAPAAAAHRRPLVLDVPSPARWAARAHRLVGRPLAAVDADAADSASMYLAEWLGHLGELPVAVVLMDGRAEADDPESVVPERLTEYTAVRNVARHLGWSVALRTADTVEVGPGEPVVGVIPPEFWAGAGALPAGDVLLGTLPPTATPETVLTQLARADR